MFDPITGSVKIIDFGFACSCKERLRVFCGTPSYMSPEIVSGRAYSGEAADVWACGIILYFMLTGHLPFKSVTEKELFRKIKKGIVALCCLRPPNDTSVCDQNKN